MGRLKKFSKSIGSDFAKRTKKAAKLTPSEKKAIKKLKPKLPSKKKVVSVGKKIDFNRLF